MKKRVLALLALIPFVLVMLAGCTNDEIGFYKTVQEMQQMKNYSFSGSIGADIKSLSAANSSDTELQTQLDAVKEMLQGYRFAYNGRVDTDNNLLDLNIVVQQSGAPDTPFLNMKADGETISLNKDFAEAYLPDTIPHSEYTDTGVAYLKYQISDLVSYFKGSGDPVIAPQSVKPQEIDSMAFLPMIVSLMAASAGNEELQANISKTVDAWSTTLFKDTPDLNIVKKSDSNKYQLHLETGSLLNAAAVFNYHILSHSDETKAALTLLANNLSDQDFETLGGTRDELLADIDSMEFPSADQLAQIKDEMTAGTASEIDSLKKLFNYSLDASLTKTGTHSYRTDASLNVKITGNDNDDNGPLVPFSADVTVTANSVVNSDGDVSGVATQPATSVSSSGARIALNSVQGSVENGVYVSLNPDMSGAVQVKGQNGSVALTGLKPATTYYVQQYFTDAQGNIVRYKSTSFTTAKANGQPVTTPVSTKTKNGNPDTGDTTGVAFVVFAAASAAGAALVLGRRVRAQGR